MNMHRRGPALFVLAKDVLTNELFRDALVIQLGR